MPTARGTTSAPSGPAPAWPARFTPEDEAPGVIRGGMGDHVTALALVAGINAALLARQRTGQGQLVDTSLLRAGIWSVGWDIGIQLRFGRLAPTLPRTADDEPDRQPLPGR